jgi:hypothetical protein
LTEARYWLNFARTLLDLGQEDCKIREERASNLTKTILTMWGKSINLAQLEAILTEASGLNHRHVSSVLDNAQEFLNFSEGFLNLQ